MNRYRDKIVVIAGPTATGKSSIALEIAKKFNGQIINGDSRQVYTELKTGTAQPTPDLIDDNLWQIDGVNHYLYGYVSIDQQYSMFRYLTDIEKLLSAENIKLPIIVGGTGLYIDSFVYGFNNIGVTESASTNPRESLLNLDVNQLRDLIPQEILNRLNNSDANNPRRLVRIIERGDVSPQYDNVIPTNILYIVYDPGKEFTDISIAIRVKQMMHSGLEREARSLWEKGCYKFPSVSKTIGYSEFVNYFEGKETLQEVENTIITHTKQYAKRQRSWFRRNINAIRVSKSQEIESEVKNFLTI